MCDHETTFGGTYIAIFDYGYYNAYKPEWLKGRHISER